MLHLRRVGLLASAIAAALAVAQAPAHASAGSDAAAASAVYITSDPVFGGRFYCGGAYESGNYNCEDGVVFGSSTFQVFVIGTDHAVWTIWTHNGGSTWSNWVSLGGKGYSYVWFTNYHDNGAFTINVIGGDGNSWHKDRHSNGTWSGWYGPS
jgi:hypothetical protein